MNALKSSLRTLVALITLLVCLSSSWGFSTAEEKEDELSAIQLSAILKLAEQGDLLAQQLLGDCYTKGEGVPKDYAEAAKWYRMAAEQGEARAQCNVGLFYYTGQGVPKDDAEAVKWYYKTAEQGDATAQYAQYSLGVCYANGTGVPQDLVNSYKWILIANASGHEGAKIAKKSFKEFLKRKQIAEAQKLSRQWKPKAQ